MPEQLTRHPEVTLQVLKSGGARCGEGLPQEILRDCPAARFCKLPGGEVCVHGLADASRMTQISTTDWRAVQMQFKENMPARHAVPLGTLLIAVAIALAAGWLAANSWREFRRRQRLRRECGPR
jgi:hypothetical protein